MRPVCYLPPKMRRSDVSRDQNMPTTPDQAWMAQKLTQLLKTTCEYRQINRARRPRSKRPRGIRQTILRRKPRQCDVVLHTGFFEQASLVRIDGLCAKVEAFGDVFLA